MNNPQHMTVGKLIQLFPESMLKNIFEDKESQLWFWQNRKDHEYLETPGDIQDLLSILQKDIHYGDYRAQSIEEFVNIKNLAMASWLVLHRDTFIKLEEIQSFKTRYPNLFQTILVWAWS